MGTEVMETALGLSVCKADLCCSLKTQRRFNSGQWANQAAQWEDPGAREDEDAYTHIAS